MFFCSAEHQKSKVCGNKSNPFTWPLLSKDEAKQALDLWELAPHADHSDERVATFGVRMKQVLGTTKKDFETLLDSISEGSTGKPLQRHYQERVLFTSRPYAGLVASAPTMAIGTQDDVLLSQNTWQLTSSKFGNICQSLDRPFPEPYSSGLKHRLLIHFHLEQLAAMSDTPERRHEHKVMASYAFDAVKLYLRNEVRLTHPKEELSIVQELMLTFIPQNDEDLPPGMPTPQQDPGFYGFKR